MNHVTTALTEIERAAKAEGLAALSRRSGVPYTTLIDWQKAGWRPRAVATLERLAHAAAAIPANDDAPASEAA
ncbi:hypothetical protein [Brevundimonas diminuta]|uniref:hypothetical protein n=1 Tax=Brevundimonas diminuta TaxID=293 RepID=UPI000207EC8B|nr:hypothetical protein [Brevundimonas diminuta]EGF96763.1 hypothetical protein BDIM_05710 [Brevundimonas diminuta ATCC 11568]OWR16589.1 hypothetical protein CD944_16350 [Brevundimonas diminuta]WQE44799.1 hypothetical protein U0020_14565 [Brevundimonas diminuta]SUW17312.1 Uncharacterised protein [Brevundimonas diminuta]